MSGGWCIWLEGTADAGAAGFLPGGWGKAGGMAWVVPGAAMAALRRRGCKVGYSWQGRLSAMRACLQAGHEVVVVAWRRPKEEWPEEGQIIYQDVWMRYRPELDPVLKGGEATLWYAVCPAGRGTMDRGWKLVVFSSCAALVR
mgnify:CR=1 FL=1